MITIHNKIEYDCECHSYCNEGTYIRTEQDASGYTTFFFGNHDGKEEHLCLNDRDIHHLKIILNNI